MHADPASEGRYPVTAPPVSSTDLLTAAAALRGEAHKHRFTAAELHRGYGGLDVDPAALRLAAHMEARASLYERCSDAAERCGRGEK